MRQPSITKISLLLLGVVLLIAIITVVLYLLG